MSEFSEAYAAVVNAAALLATSPVCSRKVQGEAEDYVRAEIKRWTSGDVSDFESEAAEGPNDAETAAQ